MDDQHPADEPVAERAGDEAPTATWADGGDPAGGDAVVNLSFAGTGILVGTSLAAAISPDGFGRVHAVASVILFAVGAGALLWAYALGIARSRYEEVTLAGLFFLAEATAPRLVRRRLRGALAVQVVVAVAAASIRPFTDVAFGILAPMVGLGLLAYWGGRHGRFPPRRPTKGSGRG